MFRLWRESQAIGFGATCERGTTISRADDLQGKARADAMQAVGCEAGGLAHVTKTYTPPGRRGRCFARASTRLTVNEIGADE